MDQRQLDEMLASAVHELGIAGASLALLRGDETVVATAGFADVEAAEAVTPATRFKVASVTKPMVATVIMRLAARGELGLDDPLATRVPTLADSAWANEATIRMLLTGTSGVPMTVARDQTFEADGDDALAMFAADLADDDPTYPPGTAWSYSNTAWSLLGRVIEVATSSRWEDAMRAELFEPAGMTGATFGEPGARHYRAGPEPIDPALDVTVRALGPAGGSVHATIADVARFAHALLRDDVVPHAYGEQMRAEGAAVGITTFLDAWCHGMARWDWPGGPAYGWDGIWLGHRAILRLVPGCDAAVIMLANTANGRDLYRRVFPAILSSFGVTFPTPTVAAEPIPDLARYAGAYAWPDRRYEIDAAGDGLVLRVGDASLPLRAVDERTFVADVSQPDTTIGFGSFDADGRPQLCYSLVWGMPRVAG